jgi:hypothetical protein
MISHIMKVIGTMTLRPNSGEGNAHEHPDPGRPTDDRDPLLTLRAAFILLAAVIAAVAAGALVYLMNGSVPGAVLTAGSAIATVIIFLNTIVGR